MANRKLLLADDSITIQKVVNLTFADEGIEVITVGDGDSAMEKFAEFTPDLVMADVNMPGLNGYEICEIIKRNEATSQIPVILLVGSFEPFDEDEANRVGANGFLTKPFQSIRQLVGKVTDLLSDGENVSAKSPTGFTATLEMPKDEVSAAIELGDTGMDDEMIETSQVGGFSEEETSAVETEPEEEMSEAADDHLKTQTLSAEEMREFSFSSTDDEAVKETAEESDFEAETTAETQAAAEIAEDEAEEVFTPEASRESVEELVYEEPTDETYDEKGFGIISDDLESSQSETEASFESDEFVEDAETSSVTGSEIVSDEESEPQESADTENQIAMTKEISPMSFDDADLLELPPLVEETGIRPSADVAKAEVQAESEEPQTAAETEPSAAFSPELIEAIAAKVAEKLSDKVLKNLVADVVPEVTEQIIREIAEENLKK